ncbi:MAG TPA: hypothetical protein VH143_02650 [Kofleriaceae bacterium]|nr:hypothetical protein [Kofleriaceae bacterium]
MSERDDMPAALQVALASQHVEVAVQPESPAGALRLDRAATAQRVAMGMNADAGVWIDGGEIWVVSADGRYVRHAPVPGDASPRVFAAIAASLLDELLAPPEAASVGVDVHVDVTPNGPPVAAPPVIVAAPPPQAIVAAPIAVTPYAVAAPSYAPPPSVATVSAVDAEPRFNVDRTLFELGASLSTASFGLDGEVAFPLTPKLRFGVLVGLDHMWDGFADLDAGDTLIHGGGELRYVGAGRNHVDLGIGGGVAHDTNESLNGGFAMGRVAFTHELGRQAVSLALAPMILFDFDGQYENNFTLVASFRVGFAL